MAAGVNGPGRTSDLLGESETGRIWMKTNARGKTSTADGENEPGEISDRLGERGAGRTCR